MYLEQSVQLLQLWKYDKCIVTNAMWQIKCDNYNVTNIIWQMQCDKCNVDTHTHTHTLYILVVAEMCGVGTSMTSKPKDEEKEISVIAEDLKIESLDEKEKKELPTIA